MAPNREKVRMYESDGISTKKNARPKRAATQNKARSKKAKRGNDEDGDNSGSTLSDSDSRTLESLSVQLQEAELMHQLDQKTIRKLQVQNAQLQARIASLTTADDEKRIELLVLDRTRQKFAHLKTIASRIGKALTAEIQNLNAYMGEITEANDKLVAAGAMDPLTCVTDGTINGLAEYQESRLKNPRSQFQSKFPRIAESPFQTPTKIGHKKKLSADARSNVQPFVKISTSSPLMPLDYERSLIDVNLNVKVNKKIDNAPRTPPTNRRSLLQPTTNNTNPSNVEEEPSGFTSFLDENEEATGLDDAKIDYSANSHSPNLSDVYDRRTGCWSEKMYVPTEESKNEEEEVIERSWIGLSEREKQLRRRTNAFDFETDPPCQSVLNS